MQRAGLFFGLLLAIALDTPAQAAGFPQLRNDQHIQSRLLAASIGYEIQKACPAISPKWFKVLREKLALEAYARKAGFSRKTVKAYLGSADEQERMRRLVDGYLEQAGVDPASSESYCALGRSEISRKTFIGSLLKEK